MSEKLVIKNKTCAYISDTGYRTGIRILVVASITYGIGSEPFEWAAYEGYVSAKMEANIATELIAKHGDKIGEKEAISLAPHLSDVRYRP